jgi:hypothetical protein
MTFKLVQHSSNRANTIYHVLDAGDGTVLGSINCPRGEENTLLSHWRDSVPAAAAATAGKQARAANAMVAALRRGPRMSKAAILRGC